jgi:hypothetical protein
MKQTKVFILTLQRRMASPTYNNPGIAAVIQDQQLERLNFASGLRQDPGGYSQYQQQNINAIMTDIQNRKQSSFQKAQIDLGRYMDMQHNVNFYKVRSNDVNNITDAILTNNNKIDSLLQQDKMNSRRQFEINEWYNYNKLDTLYFLQVFFIATLVAAIVMFWAKKGVIGVGLAGICYGIIGLTVVIVGLYRYFYTIGARDTRLWHRRYFASTPAAPPPTPGCPPSSNPVMDQIDDAMSLAMQGAVAAGQCANNINKDIHAVSRAAQDEMVGVQQGTINALEQLGTTGGAAYKAVCGA